MSTEETGLSSVTGAAAGAAVEAVQQVRAAAGSVASDVAAGRWRRAGLVGLSLGVVAAGAAAGVAVERLTIGRDVRRRAGAELEAAAPFGSLRGRPRTVAAPDGTELYVELDGSGWLDSPQPPPDAVTAAADTAPAAAPARKGWLGRFRPGGGGPLGGVLSGVGSMLGMVPTPPLTVVFCHGYCLNQDVWHFQRAALREGLRLVFWDQRSHGRSERSRSHLAGEPASIDQLGGDLKAVIDAVAPTGPLVLVGHSMGGMTVMALADQHPQLFRDRVAAVALLGTTAGSWSGVTLGLPAYGAKMLHRVAPGVLRALGRQRDLVERSRRLGSDLTSAVYRKFSFGREDVDPAVERFAQRLLEATPIDVVAEFFPAFDLHEKTAALAAFRDVPTLVMCGTKDLLTPPRHSQAIAAELPDAELVVVPDAGHLLMLELPDLVDTQLALLLEQAARGSGAPLPQPVRDLALGTAPAAPAAVEESPA
ncbi:alpha/beta fold hydrolase [Streptacidiphilus carbonis]|uniref:alpha/beta fold hydrolase n=1 Tax=Streptacidiphilus carbonis TaxID=105422 RepID=UPI0009FDB2E6|nr:alpha/beta hydrolase [Streptacidiphilus carbonis]